MANTYSQLYIHVVFAVKGRANLINPNWKNELYGYIAGIIKSKGHKPIIVNGFTDHIHCFIGLKPTMALSDLVRDIKNNSSKFINDKNWVKGRFRWQEGFGAFSYAHSQIEQVYQYILKQEEHHKRKNFKEEFVSLLDKFEIDFQQEYLFDWIDDEKS